MIHGRPFYAGLRLVRHGNPRSVARVRPAGASFASPPLGRQNDVYVGGWFLGCAGLVLGTIVLGGITRLTESGLSITQWNPIGGLFYPGSREAWEIEFSKYAGTPEHEMLNKQMSLAEFKRIYRWEWAHRNMARLVGVAFGVPGVYLIAARRISGAPRSAALACTLIVCAQAGLGWHMVRSGLDPGLLESGEHPRVSAYRLAAHLGLGVGVYVLSLAAGLSLLDTRARGTCARATRLGRLAHGAAGITGITLVSGAFVAGLDAGLVYSTWPLMGDRWVPPLSELSGRAAWRAPFENPVLAQLDHRILGYTALGAALMVSAQGLKSTSKSVRRACVGVGLAAGAQASLGVLTLIYMVPVPLAALHQAGALGLLTSYVWLLHILKRIARK